jgi:hypothetical protein
LFAKECLPDFFCCLQKNLNYFCKLQKKFLIDLKKKIMGVWRQIGEYLWIVKKDPDAPKSKWIGYMHFINRLSILLFLLAIIIIIIQLLRR